VTTRKDRQLRIVIIGAGPGGLCMGIRLAQAGFEDFVILEKSDRLGGTWNHNRYPGLACDIPSHLYSFSFEPKPDWSRPYAPQSEILEYIEHCADRYDVRRFCRFNAGVRSAIWDESAARWTLELSSGESIQADVVVSALGMFNELATPEIEGLDSFAGTRIHSAAWNWDHDLAGETVGVIGSAGSAVQLVPEVAKMARHVILFQRSANWVLPKEDTPYTEEQLEHFRHDPEAVQAVRQEIFEGIETGQAFYDAKVRAGIEAEVLQAIEVVEDPEVRAKLVPDHMWGCKRPLFSNDYYKAFNRPNLELVTEAIDRVTPRSILTVDGKEYPIDTLVLATGFAATKYLSAIEVQGRGGLRIADAWSDGAQAYKGITTAGFPNLFMLYGPNTNQGSIITMIEWQVDHALNLIRRLVDEDLAWIDVKPERMAEYNEQLQKDIDAVEPWHAGGCRNYYRSPSGRVVTQWPHNMGAFKRVLEEIDPEDYEVARR
jgi:cation diffusion facilitator CzcD-associated flavoprotein CzcO